MSARLLIELCGLSHREAAEFLNVREDTVKSWFRTRPNIAKPGVTASLRALAMQQKAAAARQIDLIGELIAQHGAPDQIELSLSSDDYEAQSKGWPCVGAERRAYAIVAGAVSIPVTLVPRGSTPASAAASDQHDKP